MAFTNGIRKLAIAAVAGLTLTMVGVQPAAAQGGGRGPGGMGGFFGGGAQMYEPSVSSRDLDGFASLFALDASQKDAVKALFDGYQQQFASASKKAKDEIDRLQQDARDDPSLFPDVLQKRQVWQKTRVEMETSFLNDYKVVLTEQQATKWPKFERMRRRETTVQRGVISGERVDLFKLVDDLKLPADQKTALTPVLDQYEVDLDRELIERNKMQEEIQAKMRDFMQDPQSADDWIKKGRDAAIKVRDVNRRYQAQLETALPEDKRAQFQAAFKRESFPQVYRESYTTRVVEAAAKLKDLTEEQKSGLAAVQDQYYRDLKNVQKDMESAQEDQEMNFSIAGMFGGRRGGQGGNNNNNNNGGRNNNNNNNNNTRGTGGGAFGDDTAMRDLRRKRTDLERGAEDKIKALLTEKQVDKLPTRDANDTPGNRGGNTDNTPRRGAGTDTGGRRPGRDE